MAVDLVLYGPRASWARQERGSRWLPMLFSIPRVDRIVNVNKNETGQTYVGTYPFFLYLFFFKLFLLPPSGTESTCLGIQGVKSCVGE